MLAISSDANIHFKLLRFIAEASRKSLTALQILEAQQRIAAGQQFAAVAGEMSEDKARQGGDLGWKRRQEVVGAFADAAFKLEVRIHQYALHASLHQLDHLSGISGCISTGCICQGMRSATNGGAAVLCLTCSVALMHPAVQRSGTHAYHVCDHSLCIVLQ